MESLKIYKDISSRTILLDKLDKFVGKKVEIIINAINDNTNEKNTTGLRGSLQAYSSPEKISKEKIAWAQAVKDKHDS